MQIDSAKLHEALNRVALKCHNHDITTAFECLKMIRLAIIDIEADAAFNKAKNKCRQALEGVEDK